MRASPFLQIKRDRERERERERGREREIDRERERELVHLACLLSFSDIDHVYSSASLNMNSHSPYLQSVRDKTDSESHVAF